jgi:hypothetical protein
VIAQHLSKMPPTDSLALVIMQHLTQPDSLALIHVRHLSKMPPTDSLALMIMQ